MKKTNFQRLTALILALTFLLCGGIVTTAAADDGEETVAQSEESSLTKKRLSDIQELLNAISYEEYCNKYENYSKASKSVYVDAVENVYPEKMDKGFFVTQEELAALNDTEKSKHAYVDTFDGQKAVYTPSDGMVSWKAEIPESGKYTIKIGYYPVEGKSASIERVFKIDGAAPFLEARYLTINKNWVCEYPDGEYTLGKKDSSDALIAEAKEAGIEAYTKADESGKVFFKYPSVWTQASSEFCNKYTIRFFMTDIEKNELRSTAVQKPVWTEYIMHDSSGYYTETFEFYLEAGERVLSLDGQNEPMAISFIELIPAAELPTYDEYFAKVSKYENKAKDVLQIEAEYTNATSSKTIYPIEDRSDAATSPKDTSRTLLNTLGAEKWETAGQFIDYTFKVSDSGLYDFITRFRQNILDGMYVCRSMEIYSHGLDATDPGYYWGAPFAEAKDLRFNYGSTWQVTKLTDGSKVTNEKGKEVDKTFEIYLSADADYYTVRFEVTLGSMGDIIREVEDVLNSINNDYLTIRKLTGTNPDSYRDYGFSRVMPDTLIDMIIQSRVLDNSDNKKNDGYTPGLSERLTDMAGTKSSNVATLQKVASLLNKMGTDEDEIAGNLDKLKSYIGNLGTFLSDAKTQPLQFDYIVIRPAESTEKMPRDTANFWQALCHEVASFFQSFFRDYNSMGALEEDYEGGIEVWMEYGRDQSQVIRSLINNDFTPDTGIPVDLKLVAGGTLLPSILAGSGPDVYLGMDQGTVINYAIRSALIGVEDQKDFDQVIKNFTEAAMLVLGIEDADNNMHYYGLPERQSFAMMFVREDVLAQLEIEIPQTWDDLLEAVPVLQQKKMEIGLTTDYSIFLYQNGGELFADDGMRINLDSVTGLSSFEFMCNFFTQYSFPYVYDAANRFRTGEMPIIVSDYTGMYNQLKVFATEIEGLWSFYPMPGIKDADGNINNVSISSVAAAVMVSGVDDKAKAWEYMKWYTGAECQTDYSNEMVAVLGPSAKHPTANREALASLPWTTSEYNEISAQFNNLAAVPNYPGAYIIGRYTNFAFLAAYNNGADPSDSLLSYIYNINKEISRKRDEFGLETLESGQTLAAKRLAQLYDTAEANNDTILARLEKNSAYKSEYDSILKMAKQAVRSQDIAALNNAAEKLAEIEKSLDPDGSIFSKEIVDIMGYDMHDTTLSDSAKDKVRKCYYYQAYEKAESMVSQLHFAAEFMMDAADALSSY